MTVRLFVTSSALMIFSWLAATYLRAVPMDSYPTTPVVTSTAESGAISLAHSEPGESAVRLIAIGAR